MPSVSALIRKVARNNGVQQYIVEKDYALSYLLAAIGDTEGLCENLVLKGGTALRKLYFPDYRFSEDLDYSTLIVGSIPKVDALMETAIQRMRDGLNERGPFQISLEPLVLPYPHPGDQKAYTVRVQFPEQRQALCRLKVEITVDEPVLLPYELRSILHCFPEEIAASVRAYSLVEIAAEKLRALLQSNEKLRKTGWGASRVCRDYYDLWNILRHPGVAAPELIALLDKKCSVRGVVYADPRDFIAETLLAVARAEWNQQLLPFVPSAPPASSLLPEVEALIFSVWE